MALERNGMESLLKNNKGNNHLSSYFIGLCYLIFKFFCAVLSLQELCCRAIVARTSVYSIEQLPLPKTLKSCLKSFSSMSNYGGSWRPSRHQYRSPKEKRTIANRAKALFSCDNFTKALSSTSTTTTPTNTLRSNNGRHRSHNNHQNRFCSVS